VAWESNGHGDFTVRATPILSAGLAGLTHEAFQQRITAAFGASPRQHPTLDCAPTVEKRALLQPLNRPILPTPVPGAEPGQPGSDGLDTLAQRLKLLIELLTQWR
jgi:hypothetical protein